MGTTNARGDEPTGRFAVNYCPVDTFCEAGLNPIDDFDFGTNAPRVAKWLEARYEAIDEVGACYLVARCGADVLTLALLDRNCSTLAEIRFDAPEDEVPAATFVAFLATCEAWRSLATGEFTEPDEFVGVAGGDPDRRLVLGSGAGSELIEADADGRLFTVNGAGPFTASQVLEGYGEGNNADWFDVFKFVSRIVFGEAHHASGQLPARARRPLVLGVRQWRGFPMSTNEPATSIGKSLAIIAARDELAAQYRRIATIAADKATPPTLAADGDLLYAIEWQGEELLKQLHTARLWAPLVNIAERYAYDADELAAAIDDYRNNVADRLDNYRPLGLSTSAMSNLSKAAEFEATRTFVGRSGSGFGSEFARLDWCKAEVAKAEQAARA